MINEQKKGDNNVENVDANKTIATTKKIKPKVNKAEIERIKQKYFDYYDDIKISDRQDW